MARLTRYTIALLIIAAAAGLIWQKTRPEPMEVNVVPVTRGTVESTVANTRAGTVEACRRARLSPSIGGQIARLPIHEGDEVAAGSLLLEIWNEDLAAQLNLAEQEKNVADAQAKAACHTAAEAGRQAARAEKLRRQAVNSEEQTDQAVSQARSQQAQCDAAQASVATAQARIDLARANLSRTRLIAPFAGIIAKIEGELNEYVTPSPVGVQTPPAIDLIENSCYYVLAPIDEVDAAAVRLGMPTRISLDAFKDKEFAGTVRRISPYVLDLEKQARTVDIEVAFTNQADFKDLLAGYSADVEIILATGSATLKIPTEAVLEGQRVYVYSPTDGKLTVTKIETGLSNWATTEVRAGLKEGEMIVTNVDKAGLKDGAIAVAAKAAP